jgi:hypothetical protein
MAAETGNPEHVRIVARVCTDLFGPSPELTAPPGYPDSLALCIVDAVQSPGVKYVTVERVVRRYRSYRAESGGNADKDGASELLDTFSELGGVVGWIKRIGTYNRTPPRQGAPYKAAAIRESAHEFLDVGVTSAMDLRNVANAADSLASVRDRWIRVIGQTSGVTWHYLLMLAGVPGVKADRMTAKFVSRVLFEGRERVQPEIAAAIVSHAADELGVSRTVLDYYVWQWQRRQQREPRAFVS